MSNDIATIWQVVRGDWAVSPAVRVSSSAAGGGAYSSWSVLFPPGITGTFASRLDALAAAAAAKVVVGGYSGYYQPGTTYVGFATSSNPVMNIFGAGARDDQAQAFADYYYATAAPTVVGDTSDHGGAVVCNFLLTQGAVPDGPDVYLDREFDPSVTGADPSNMWGPWRFLSLTSGDPLTPEYPVFQNNCTNFPSNSLGFPQVVMSPFTVIRGTGWVSTPGGETKLTGPAGSDLARGSDLVTSVLISLFTDRVANPDDVIPDGGDDPRGFWADEPQYPAGSRLWLIDRAKRTQETLALAKGYIEEALQWLIDDAVVSRIEVALEWSALSTLSARITVYAPEGAAYGAEPLLLLDTLNLFRLSDVQAWGWNAEIGSGQWVSLATSPEPAGGIAPTPPDTARVRITEDGMTRYTQDGSRRITE